MKIRLVTEGATRPGEPHLVVGTAWIYRMDDQFIVHALSETCRDYGGRLLDAIRGVATNGWHWAVLGPAEPLDELRRRIEGGGNLMFVLKEMCCGHAPATVVRRFPTWEAADRAREEWVASAWGPHERVGVIEWDCEACRGNVVAGKSCYACGLAGPVGQGKLPIKEGIP